MSVAKKKPKSRWRVGRKLGRTLYLDDELVGVVDESFLAVWIVTRMNGGHGDSRETRDRIAAWLRAEAGKNRSLNLPPRKLSESEIEARVLKAYADLIERRCW